MAKLSNDELIEAFKEMSLIELSEFVKQFEDVFDVTAAAPVAVAAGAAAGGGEAPAEEEEKTEFDVILESAGSAKIAVKIGRASCRERVWRSVVAGGVKRKSTRRNDVRQQ